MDTSVIAEVEQCSCGVLFPIPRLRGDYYDHMCDGQHNKALHITICGPCFIGGCNLCEGTRGSTDWRCGCRHEAKLADICEMAAHSIALTWSTWLANGRASEATGRAR